MFLVSWVDVGIQGKFQAPLSLQLKVAPTGQCNINTEKVGHVNRCIEMSMIPHVLKLSVFWCSQYNGWITWRSERENSVSHTCISLFSCSEFNRLQSVVAENEQNNYSTRQRCWARDCRIYLCIYAKHRKISGSCYVIYFKWSTRQMLQSRNSYKYLWSISSPTRRHLITMESTCRSARLGQIFQTCQIFHST